MKIGKKAGAAQVLLLIKPPNPEENPDIGA